MIANNEINENGIIFSHPSLVGPWKFYCPFRKGVGNRKDLICKDVYLYAVWIY